MLNKNSIETPLHYHADQESSYAAGSGNTGIVIKEYPLLSHLILRGRATDSAFVDGVALSTQLNISRIPNRVVSIEQESIYWLGPSEWLLVSPYSRKDELKQALDKHLSGHVAVVDVSGGQTMLNLQGEHVHEVLMKSSVYDFHPDNFQPGKCVQTTFAKAGALVSKKNDGSFDLIIRRSFADYIAEWLIDASKEYGCRIEVGFNQ